MLNHLLNFLKGAGMGAADVVPGVSGGTVALLVGIYERLIRAITSFDRKLLRLIREKRIRAALDHIDWQFVVALGAGLVTGFIVTVTTLAHYLETDATRSLILAAFFGMIIAATIIVGRMIARLRDGNSTANLVMVAIGLAISLTIFFLQLGREEATADPSLWYLFVCGAISICAMILPGISGALVLILLGVYEPLVGKVKAFLQFEEFGENFVVCLCFGLGAVTGLMCFSRILRILLDRYTGPTLSLLCGLMLGSLPLLWPFQVNKTPGVEDLKERVYQPIWPEAFDTHFVKHVAIAIAAILLVLVAEWIGTRMSASKRDVKLTN